jgi:hypothetical protein
MPPLSLLFLLVAFCLFWASGMLAGQRRKPWVVWQIFAAAVTFGAQAIYATSNPYHPALLVFPALVVIAIVPTLFRLFGLKFSDSLLHL